MSTWSLTGVDKTAALAATSYNRQVSVGLGVESQCCVIVSASWMTVAKLHVDCSASPKTVRSALRSCL